MQKSKRTYHNRKALPLVSQSEDGLSIGSEALQFISSLPPKHCHVLTIVGRAKTGKSTLMNHLIHQFTEENELEEYFPVSDHLGGGTKGINLLTTYVELEDDSILLFLDVEGLGRFTNSQNYESKLFAVALLLSTTLIYNNIGPIDEPALQNLSVFIEIGKMFQKSILKRDQNCSGEVRLPSLFMVLRDFSLKLENKEGFDVTARQYLETALNEQKGGSQTILHKNRIRRTIKQLFKERNCQTLVLPSDELPLNFKSSLRSQFQSDLSRLSRKLMTHIKEASENRRLLIANQLSLYVTELLETVNMNIRVPRFDNILTNVHQKQIQTVKEQFKNTLNKLSKQFQSQSIQVEHMINSIKLTEGGQQNFIQDEINNLEKIAESLHESYSKARRQIEDYGRKNKADVISGEGYKNQSFLDAQELKILESAKNFKEEEINKKIQDLRQIAAIQKRMLIQQQLQQQQVAQFQKITTDLCLIQDDKQLEKKYRAFIYNLRDRCNKISSKEFETGILKCEIAYLRRKIQLKERVPSECISCKLANIQQTKMQQNILRERQNNPEMSFTYNMKNQSLQSRDLQCQKLGPSKSFYVPYIILSDSTVMNVEIIRTLIKQDHRLNNYIQYVLEVVIFEKRWVLNRKWKDFNELHSILTSLFEKIQLPEFANVQLSLKVNLEVHKAEVEERRQKLEKYVRKLLEIEPIRNSRIMQKFLKINKEYFPTL